jgi:hypothetical protein
MENSVVATEFPRFLANLREEEPTTVTVKVRGHDDRNGHRRTIEGALRELVGVWECDAAGIFASVDGSGFVQTLVHPGKPSIYGEAVDLDAHGCGHLTANQRDRLSLLGWHDPKVETMPYHDPAYAADWADNFVREWPLPEIGLKQIAAVFASTLRAIYCLPPANDLLVELIRYRDDGGGGSGTTIRPTRDLVAVS